MDENILGQAEEIYEQIRSSVDDTEEQEVLIFSLELVLCALSG